MSGNNLSRRILPLPREVVDRIAAGEVIERPASVARELIDNALDAGATTIRIELREGGLRMLRVADDGAGIAADELELACQPHTTSKVRSLADLDAIETLGFRGEALASIAAVAELEIVSADDDDGVATALTLRDGQPHERATVARARGATVTVRELFAHVPARRALLRGPRAEASRVATLARAYALAHPAIRFTLLDDGRQTLSTPGTTLADTLATLYGAELARHTLTIGPLESDGATLRGVVTTRAIHLPTRDAIFLAVNGRPVANRALLAAVEAGYRPLLRKGRHPLLALALTVAPEALDVNVHPAKTEVLLRREAGIAATLRKAVHDALGAEPVSVAAQSQPPNAPTFAHPTQLSLPAPRKRRGLRLREGRASYQLFDFGEDDEPHGGPLPELEPLGQFDDALILAQASDGDLYLVDQHRAHERILYEQLLRQRAALSTAHETAHETDGAAREDGGGEPEATALSQLLLEPLLIELTPAQAALLTPRLDELARLGLECQPFGGSVFLVRALPTLPGAAQEPVAFARELALDAAEDSDDWLDALCVSLACRSAIRRGQSLALAEQRALLADLRAASTLAVCPHGTPLLLRYSRAFLRKSFEW